MTNRQHMFDAILVAVDDCYMKEALNNYAQPFQDNDSEISKAEELIEKFRNNIENLDLTNDTELYGTDFVAGMNTDD